MTDEYPEHDRLQAIADKSQAIGEFLDWLSEQGIQRMVWRTDLTDMRECSGILLGVLPTGAKWRYENGERVEDHTYCEKCGGSGLYEVSGIEAYVHDPRSAQDLLAEYFGIDQRKIEQEKRAMLEALRKQNAA